LRAALLPLIEALFRVLFTYECDGTENVPRQGPAVIASNHPSYLDPILLSLRVRRPIRFMAWQGLFKVPVLSFLMRSFGAFPVDTRRGKGREAYETAKKLVLAGKLVGIFPEGHRSRTGWLEMGLKEGAARLAWETGAPLVPATITGAFRAWPHYQSLPQPAKIRVRFHERIDPAPYRAEEEDVALPALLGELRRRVERSLDPGVKADLRRNLLWRSPAPWPRHYEAGPPLLLALLVFWKTRALASVLPVYAYVAYLLLDHFLIPQRRITKWLRNGSPVLFALAYAPTAFQALSFPTIPGAAALVAVVLGAMFPDMYERGTSSARSSWPRAVSARTWRSRCSRPRSPGSAAASSGATRRRCCSATRSSSISSSAAARLSCRTRWRGCWAACCCACCHCARGTSRSRRRASRASASTCSVSPSAAAAAA
jgi:1-acyl-sn-glycerol-3-phosphate acyltransferase